MKKIALVGIGTSAIGFLSQITSNNNKLNDIHIDCFE